MGGLGEAVLRVAAGVDPQTDMEMEVFGLGWVGPRAIPECPCMGVGEMEGFSFRSWDSPRASLEHPWVSLSIPEYPLSISVPGWGR